MRNRAPLILALCAGTAFARDRAGDIEFFGTKGLEMTKIRTGMPVTGGNAYSEQIKGQVRRALSPFAGNPTDVAAFCCDKNGDYLLFIGLGGASRKSFQYHASPTGKQRLPSAIVEIYARRDRSLEEAVRAGGSAAAKGDSNGYAIVDDPAARKLQLKARQWMLKHEAEVREVLEHSSSDRPRRIARDALGYARQSETPSRTLVEASRDVDD